jgi:RNA polymerase sigma-70 factor (ECF subfamily)
VEKLSRSERTAFVLREAFDYPYGRIAEVSQTKESTTRKLFSRARQSIGAGRQGGRFTRGGSLHELSDG